MYIHANYSLWLRLRFGPHSLTLPLLVLISGVNKSSIEVIESKSKTVNAEKLARELCLDWHSISMEELPLNVPKKMIEVAASVACSHQSVN